MALQPYHERHEIRFPGDMLETLPSGFSDLAHQMLQFTPTHMPEPNDILDSLAYHVHLIQRGGRPSLAEVPRRSPAGLEKQWVEQFNQMQKRLPRNRRRTYQRALS